MRRTATNRLIALLLLAVSGLAQTIANPLVGTWHNVAGPPVPQTLLMIGADGYYSQIAIAPGRNKPKNDWDHRTREELMKQFGGLRASYGSWKVAGNRLTRTRTASEDPGTEGTETVVEFRFEGDVLVLKSEDAQREARFRRMK
jgi:hypothetical protein